MDAINQGFDLTVTLKQMASNVPLWAIALGLVKYWFGKTKKSDEETKLAIAGLHEKVNRIELKLAESGISDLKANIENLKESRTEHRSQITAAFKAIDRLDEENKLKRASDR